MNACANFPRAIFPAGKITAQRIPARAAYAAADAEVFPVDAQSNVCAPRSTAFETATVIPRSLNEPVGFTPSFLIHTSAPTRSLSRGEKSKGVLPSPNDTTGVASVTGRYLRYLSIMPVRLALPPLSRGFACKIDMLIARRAGRVHFRTVLCPR